MTRQVKMHKKFKTNGSGAVEIHLQFSDGEVMNYLLPISLNSQAAGYGALRKLGDLAIGGTLLPDLKKAVGELFDQWDSGDWRSRRNGPGGTSVVMKALMAHTGKSADEVRAFLASKTMKQKADIKRLPEVAAIVRGLEKPKAVPTANLLADLLT